MSTHYYYWSGCKDIMIMCMLNGKLKTVEKLPLRGGFIKENKRGHERKILIINIHEMPIFWQLMTQTETRVLSHTRMRCCCMLSCEDWSWIRLQVRQNTYHCWQWWLHCIQSSIYEGRDVEYCTVIFMSIIVFQLSLSSHIPNSIDSFIVLKMGICIVS